MVSALWDAAAANDVENLSKLLLDASQADVEISDASGLTPLILAVKAGHIDIVRMLLDRGADPNHPSSEGRPDQLTLDPNILGLLHGAQARLVAPPQMMSPPAEGMPDGNIQYWAPPPPPPGMYGYYAGPTPLPPHPGHADRMSPPQMPFYPAPMAYGPGNLPPPDVARMIPCRFYPACRYGATCMFAHPQSAPNGAFYPPPPQSLGHYGSYDPAQHAGAYGLPYYPQPGGPYHPGPVPGDVSIPMSPPHIDPSSPLASGPTPPVMHNGPLSPAQAGFAPMQMHAPNGYPMPMAAPYPVPPSGPPPPAHYQAPPGSNPAFVAHQPSAEHVPQPVSHNGPAHQRRPSTRRPSFVNSRKPPCIFFPSGRCKNGDDCRFPHVLMDGPHAPGPMRVPPRPRYPGPHANNFAGIDAKMAQMSMHDSRGPRGFGGARVEHQRQQRIPNGAPPPSKQRLPGADEFPTLSGSPTSSSRASPPISTVGLTAAQVLQAPAPARKEPREASASQPASVNGSSASNNSGSVDGDSSDQDVKAEAPVPAINGHVSPAKVPVKLPMSFAVVPNHTVMSTPELSVSA